MITNGRKLDGRYILREEIGSGGFGAVYRAVDTRFSGNNQVAIKQIPLIGEESAEAFRQEANLLYNLSHPNLPKVTNCFQEDGASFIVMEYISGEDLWESLKKGKCCTVAEALEIADAVLDALEYLHSFTIFHRDIKPHNIKIDRGGKIYLLDFGTAKGSFDETTLTRAAGQSITGFTPFYAPLEQVLRVDANSYLLLQSVETPHLLDEFLHRKTDERSDIYSLGATLYHLLTGYSPEKATATTRAFALWSGKPDPLPPCRTVKPEIPEHLAQIVHRCLEIEPEKRFQTAAELRRELKNASSDSPPPKVSERMTVALPSTRNPLNEELNPAAAKSVLTQESSLKSEPVMRLSFDIESKPEAENATVSSRPIEESSEERNPIPAAAAVKPKSKIPFYLGLLVLTTISGVFAGWLLWRNPAVTPPAETTAAKTTRNLSYSLLVQKMRGGKKFQEPFESSGQEIFETGYQFQMRLVPPADGYLYIFAEGINDRQEKVFNLIFPTPQRNEGAAAVAAARQYETGWNQFDGRTGTENFWLVWNKTVPEIAEKARADAFQNAGVVSDGNLKNQLKDYLANESKNKAEASKEVDKKITKIGFQGDRLVYLMHLEHR
ncbi:MAG TPA: protein kinase [Pyrinomonadaceae bacterium]|nr:protein kinase [Pyrinomonadaceae bacterium]